ncbi:trypsin-like peptidase domain-containing protein [Acaryochloris sp. IP29b_bin.137]|uniref:trypsin-like peptidase domain-containing protein n=1 Tax=Acaryochloris sp. IP29b_bin.137 TaxID=2969217 RepID=UPI00263829D6|nr:trypsin-like peptidase domain-containing protein [Acaryochloris sp. IP29b_bin.137]
MKFIHPLAPIMVTAIVAAPFQGAQALSSAEVSAIAEAITVRIEGQNAGSGVIIKQQADVYTVLTAAHVVATPDEYDVVTVDGQRYPLTYSQVKKFPNIDLALVEFTSSKTYSVANLGDSAQIRAGDSIYVSGFPMPTTAITESIWTFSEGKVTANAKRPLADGYGLVYSNNTLPGMSGGSVLDSQGQLIGIHGRADGERQVKRTETVYVKTGFNLGIPINTFMASVTKVSPSLGFSGPVAIGGAELTPDDLYVQGTDKFQRGNYQGAIADLNQSIDLNPQNAVAYNSRGNAYFELRQYQAAIAEYDQAIALNPNYAEAYFNRGLAHKLIGNNDQANQDQLKSKQLLGGEVESLENKADRIQQLLDQKLKPFERLE